MIEQITIYLCPNNSTIMVTKEEAMDEARECYAMLMIDHTKKNDQNGPQSMDMNTLYEIEEIDVPNAKALKTQSDLDLRESL